MTCVVVILGPMTRGVAPGPMQVRSRKPAGRSPGLQVVVAHDKGAHSTSTARTRILSVANCALRDWFPVRIFPVSADAGLDLPLVRTRDLRNKWPAL